MTEPAEQSAPDIAALAPRALSTGFARELTPIWLATTALLARREPPDLTRPFRCVYLGCGTGETAAVVAACHPHAEVWAWDRRPERLEATRRLRDAAGLTNLVVHEHTQLPTDLGGDTAEIVVLHEVLASVDDLTRRAIAGFVGDVLRPGGLVCATYPSLVGWSEIVTVQTMMRRVAQQSSRDLHDAVPEVLDLLVRLRDGGAAYLTERPIVKAWLDDVLDLEPTKIVDCYLRDELRPLSPAQVTDLLRPLGCQFVASARLTDDLDLGLSAALVEAVHAAPSAQLRETYRDLATRRTHHFDVFRLGDAPLTTDEADARIAALPLTAITANEPSTAELPAPLWNRLRDGVVTVGELDSELDHATTLLRVLVDAGVVHPISDQDTSGASVSCTALNAAWARQPNQVVAVPSLASAIPPHAGANARALHARLGVH